jgi:hypothetical protein
MVTRRNVNKPPPQQHRTSLDNTIVEIIDSEIVDADGIHVSLSNNDHHTCTYKAIDLDHDNNIMMEADVVRISNSNNTLHHRRQGMFSYAASWQFVLP